MFPIVLLRVGEMCQQGSGTTSAVVRFDGTLQCFQPYGEEGPLVADLDRKAAAGLHAARCHTSAM